MAANPRRIVSGLVAGAAVSLLLAAAGCGKVGSPEIPPNSTYPKVYPANAARPTLRVPPVEVTQRQLFTPSGAWIDPDQHLPEIDPYADVDQKGQGAFIGGTGAPAAGGLGASQPPAYGESGPAGQQQPAATPQSP
jgi:hypothetical protein